MISLSATSPEFSLLYFSSNERELSADKYDLLIESAVFADRNDFNAIWIPERHFHDFGGIYPNPSVLAAALAMVTKKIRLRSGSVVLPLHHPVRVAEEWAVVDNLSHGRVDLSFVRGWNANDFILSPDNYTDRTEIMLNNIKTVRALWNGESVAFRNGAGADVPVRIYPAPVQKELAVWITCTGDKQRFVEAGCSGANILTALLFQNLDELESKINIYKKARADSGYDPETGIVSLMLHTFIGDDESEVKEIVRKPFTEYIKSSVDLWKQMALNLEQLNEKDREQLFLYAFERYYKVSGLFGTPESCLPMIRHLQRIGVNEIACLIDFGIDQDLVMKGLGSIKSLKELSCEFVKE